LSGTQFWLDRETSLAVRWRALIAATQSVASLVGCRSWQVAQRQKRRAVQRAGKARPSFFLDTKTQSLVRLSAENKSVQSDCVPTNGASCKGFQRRPSCLDYETQY